MGGSAPESTANSRLDWAPLGSRPLVVRLLAGYLVVLVVAAVASLPRRRWLPANDNALLEIQLSRGASFGHWAGAYSRFGWYHPGPLPRFALWPEYVAFGQNGFALAVGWAVFAICLLGWAAICGHRGCLHGPVLVGGAVAAAYLAGLREAFASPWNPWMATTAIVAFAVAGLAVIRGRTHGLWLLIVAGTMACQAHLAAVAPVTVGFLSVVGLAWVHVRSMSRVMVFRVVAFAAALWSLPVLDALLHRGGNLREIAQYLRMDRAEVLGIRPALAVVGRWTAFNSPIFGFESPVEDLGNSVTSGHTSAVGPGALLLGALVVACFARRHALARELLLLLAMISAVGLAVSRNSGPLYEYTFGWLAPLVGVLMARLGLAACRYAAERRRAAAFNDRRTGGYARGWATWGRWGAALMVPTLAVACAGMPNRESQATLRAATSAPIASIPPGSVLRLSPDAGATGLETGLFRILERRGVGLRLAPDWRAFLGFALSSDGDGVSLMGHIHCLNLDGSEAVFKVVPFSRDELRRVQAFEQTLARTDLDLFVAMDVAHELGELTDGRTCLVLAPK